MTEAIFVCLPYIPFDVQVYPFGDDTPSEIERAMLGFIAAHEPEGVSIRAFDDALHLGKLATANLLNGLWRRALVQMTRSPSRIILDDRAKQHQDNDFQNLGAPSEPIKFRLGFDLLQGQVINPFSIDAEEPRIDYSVLPTNPDDPFNPYPFPLNGFETLPEHELLRALNTVPAFREARETWSNSKLAPDTPNHTLTLDNVAYFRGYFRVRRALDDQLVFTPSAQNAHLNSVLEKIGEYLPKEPAAPGEMLYANLVRKASRTGSQLSEARDPMSKLRRQQARLAVIAEDPMRFPDEFKTVWASAKAGLDELISIEREHENAPVKVTYIPKGAVTNRFTSLLKGKGKRLILASRSTFQLEHPQKNDLLKSLVSGLSGSQPRIQQAFLQWVAFGHREDTQASNRKDRARRIIDTVSRPIDASSSGASAMTTRRFWHFGTGNRAKHTGASLAMLDDQWLLLASASLLGDTVDQATGLLVEPQPGSDRPGYHPLARATADRLSATFAMGRLLGDGPVRRKTVSPVQKRLDLLQAISDELAETLSVDNGAVAGEGTTVSLDDESSLLAQVQTQKLYSESLGAALERLSEFRRSGPLVARPIFDADIFMTARNLILSAEIDSTVTVCISVGPQRLRNRPEFFEFHPTIDPMFPDALSSFLEHSPQNRVNLVMMDSTKADERQYQSHLNQLEKLAEMSGGRLKLFYPTQHELNSTTGLSFVVTPEETLIASGGIVGHRRGSAAQGSTLHVAILLRGQGHAASATQQVAAHVPGLEIVLSETPNTPTTTSTKGRKLYLRWNEETRDRHCSDIGVSVLAGEADGFDAATLQEIADAIADPQFQRAIAKRLARAPGPETPEGNAALRSLFRKAEAEGDLAALAGFADYAENDHPMHLPPLREAVIRYLKEEGNSFPQKPADYLAHARQKEMSALMVLAWLKKPTWVTNALVQASAETIQDRSDETPTGLDAILKVLTKRARAGENDLPDFAKLADKARTAETDTRQEDYEKLAKLFARITRKDYGTGSAAHIRDLAFWEDEASEFFKLRGTLSNTSLTQRQKAAAFDRILRASVKNPASALRSKGAATETGREKVLQFDAANRARRPDPELVGRRRNAMANDWTLLLAESWQWARSWMETAEEGQSPTDGELYSVAIAWLDAFDPKAQTNAVCLQRVLHSRLSVLVGRDAPLADESSYWRYPTAFDSSVFSEGTVNWVKFMQALLSQEWPQTPLPIDECFEAQLAEFRYMRCKRMLDHPPSNMDSEEAGHLLRKLVQTVRNEKKRLVTDLDALERSLAELGGYLSAENQENAAMLRQEVNDDEINFEGAETLRVYFKEIQQEVTKKREELKETLNREIAHLPGAFKSAAERLFDQRDFSAVRALIDLGWTTVPPWPPNTASLDLFNQLLRAKIKGEDIDFSLQTLLDDRTFVSIKDAFLPVLTAAAVITPSDAETFARLVAGWFGRDGPADMARAVQQHLGLVHEPMVACKRSMDDDEAPAILHNPGEGSVDLAVVPFLSRRYVAPEAITVTMEDIVQALELDEAKRREFLLDRIDKRLSFSKLYSASQKVTEPNWSQEFGSHDSMESAAKAVLDAAARFGCSLCYQRNPSQETSPNINALVGLCSILSYWHAASQTCAGKDEARLGSVLAKCFQSTKGARVFEACTLN
ncbi:hypothetical protein SAMN04487859_12338 [Roseovarius lutimaris]|uniref:Uncharacterized protein n=1 Tax=Roseovarius lutimaris TaxID=1005928 RepID=A0A1I5FZB3_9RHOB|nr:hypothetical protein [Roseovarius lutimaris]SFO29134.1 hypothetical protein SAMN04487859_12338 [Roseovarius lutimaris]